VKLNLLSDLTGQALMASLQGTAARQAAIADNIANVDTPGFIRSEVDFETALARALDTARRASSAVSPRLSLAAGKSKDYSAPARADGNNVDIDREMAALSRTALSYRAASELLSTRIRMLRAAIGQGRV
jgi:flagellar basal-body rod protein FlgB